MLRFLKVQIAFARANIRCLCKTGECVFHCTEGASEITTFVGTGTGSFFKGTIEIKKTYFSDRNSARYADESCPVCGYYCLGKGGNGCIDKPSGIDIYDITKDTHQIKYRIIAGKLISVHTFRIKVAHRGKGHSYKVFDELKNHGLPIVLECWPTLVKFYEKLGFVKECDTCDGYAEMVYLP